MYGFIYVRSLTMQHCGTGGRLSILLAKGCRGFRVQGLRVLQKKIELVGIPFEDAACTMQVVHGDAPSNIVGSTSAASNERPNTSNKIMKQACETFMV